MDNCPRDRALIFALLHLSAGLPRPDERASIAGIHGIRRLHAHGEPSSRMEAPAQTGGLRVAPSAGRRARRNAEVLPLAVWATAGSTWSFTCRDRHGTGCLHVPGASR